jgi:PIN domain nuclease of toxin-antitoxin system
MGGTFQLKYLLDTHIWIWSVSQPEKLSRKVRSILKDSSNELFISSISVWEFLVLLEKKRILIANSLEDWLNIAILEANIIEIPIDREIAIESRRLKLPQQDPADRFIAATASIHSLTLITSDDKLAGSKELSTLDNRV